MLNGTSKVKKIRIAFLLNVSNDWIGGVNYFKNLLNLIVENSQFNLEPVVFVANNCDMNLLAGYPKVEIIKTGLLVRKNALRYVSRLEEELFATNFIWQRLLKKYHVDVISHNMSKMYIKDIPILSWIPDFQHKYLPDLFSQDELEVRDHQFKMLYEISDYVILSSYDAKKDFCKFIDYKNTKGKVFQFVVPVEKLEYDKSKLLSQYGITKPFFFIPNQFWKHKNHKIVIEALSLLKKENILVCCSGNIEDCRNKDYFEMLLKYIEENGLKNNFKILGKIPYKDVQALMMECKALINPSLFEGWSTMVEEAKSLGKRIILSDLAVHKEQSPAGGIYFHRDSAKDLAEVMLDVWKEDEDVNELLAQNASADLDLRKNKAIEQYNELILSAFKI